MKKQPTEEEKKQWQEEWTRLVHDGVCCAFEDPQHKEKTAFLESLKDKEKSKDKSTEG